MTTGDSGQRKRFTGCIICVISVQVQETSVQVDADQPQETEAASHKGKMLNRHGCHTKPTS